MGCDCEVEAEVKMIAKAEGRTIEEARLTYAERQKLPKSAFCGPDRTYPAHDAAHVRNAFARLARFGKRLDKAVALRIYRCLVRRAKKFGVEHDPSKFAWLTGKKVEETAEQKRIKKIMKWFEEEIMEANLWIQKAIKKKGALRKQLGIKEGEVIPVDILRKIVNAETGSTISFRGKKIKVTTLLKRRAILALRLRAMPKRGRK